jgi:hypothetical protein
MSQKGTESIITSIKMKDRNWLAEWVPEQKFGNWLAKPEPSSENRTVAFNKEYIYIFCINIEKVMDKYKRESSRMYSIDEISIYTAQKPTGSTGQKEVGSTCNRNGIAVISMPSHASYRMQPLDITFFVPLALYFQQRTLLLHEEPQHRYITPFEDDSFSKCGAV